MDQNLMSQELSDNELEQVVGSGGHFGGHYGKPQQHKGYDHHFGHHCEPKPCYPHYRHHCEPVVRCHADADLCIW